MKVLFISKSFYTGKDLLQDRYGRVFEISNHLAMLGNDILGIALSYFSTSDTEQVFLQHQHGSLNWKRFCLGALKLPGIIRYLRHTQQEISRFQPDVIISGSDCLHVFWGGYLSRKFNIPHIVDLYDNLESFGSAKIPFIKNLFRKSISNADTIFCVSEPLATYVQSTCRLLTPPGVLINGVDKQQFKLLNKNDCRSKLNLPASRILIGTGGAISKTRGIEFLLEAFDKLSANDPGIDLVLCGPVTKEIEFPANSHLHYLGVLNSELMPFFYNSLDVCVICNIDSEFGRYCFPQKFSETVSCGVPVVSSRIGSLTQILEEQSEILFTPGSVDELINAIFFQLNNRRSTGFQVPTWEEQALKVHTAIKQISSNDRG
jgi:teichuronic acid biosynthesis glycosyltransferase TuaC